MSKIELGYILFSTICLVLNDGIDTTGCGVTIDWVTFIIPQHGLSSVRYSCHGHGISCLWLLLFLNPKTGADSQDCDSGGGEWCVSGCRSGMVVRVICWQWFCW